MPKGGYIRGMIAALPIIVVAFFVWSVIFPPEGTNIPTTTQTSQTTATDTPEVPNVPAEPQVTQLPAEPSPAEIPSEPTASLPAEPAASTVPSEPTAVVPTAPTQTNNTATTDTTTPITSAPDFGVATLGSGDSSPGLSLGSLTADSPSTPSSAAPAALANAAPAETVSANTDSATRPSGGFDNAGQAMVAPNTRPVEQPTTAPPAETAFAAFSQPYVDAGQKPYLSIILLAENSGQAQAVASLAANITLAVETTNPKADQIINAYRSLGGEVVLVYPASGPDDLSQSADSILELMSKTLINTRQIAGIMDDINGTLATTPDAMGSVLQALSVSGHALITTNGQASPMAAALKVPTSHVARYINSADGKIPIIRDMDIAVDELAGNSALIIYGVADEDTIAALGFWMKSSKSQTVALAPASAAIRNQ